MLVTVIVTKGKNQPYRYGIRGLFKGNATVYPNVTHGAGHDERQTASRLLWVYVNIVLDLCLSAP